MPPLRIPAPDETHIAKYVTPYAGMESELDRFLNHEIAPFQFRSSPELADI
jgi:hypothetical protein